MSNDAVKDLFAQWVAAHNELVRLELEALGAQLQGRRVSDDLAERRRAAKDTADRLFIRATAEHSLTHGTRWSRTWAEESGQPGNLRHC